MKVAVMGAGAVGCFYGALLHKAGHEVVLIGRPALVEAVRAQGLRLQAQGTEELLPLRADSSAQAVQGADLVLFCVKSGDTESAGAAIKPFLAAHCAVLCMQNGADNAERLTRGLQRQAIAVAVYVAVGMTVPGHVIHYGRNELVLGASPHSESLARMFNAAGIRTTVTERVLDTLWTKLTINCAWNPLSALTQLPYGELAQRPGIIETMRAVVTECQAVAEAAGMRLPESIWDDTFRIGLTMPGQRSSTAHDVARGRQSEIDFINGYVVREGERLGVPTPVNRLLHSLVKVKDAAAPQHPQPS
jgi:2-dehydropantoate 2-reductase